MSGKPPERRRKRSFFTPLSVIAERCRFPLNLKREDYEIQAPTVIRNLNLWMPIHQSGG